ncbi:hypothetical protein scyTo_0017850 [Scyliorhinus torazame]|uniref:Insulin-like domain-containing protein n=1 Tax=Scyliorhinus torazame TaxID=75743 RepID=A0A401Q1C8_SCYTO|nr:hypothetical protein [Scyliorhinus torazame]
MLPSGASGVYDPTETFTHLCDNDFLQKLVGICRDSSRQPYLTFNQNGDSVDKDFSLLRTQIDNRIEKLDGMPDATQNKFTLMTKRQPEIMSACCLGTCTAAQIQKICNW